MDISRRILMTTAPGLAAGAMIMPAASAAASPQSVLATDFGLKPNSTKDQSRALQSAIEAAVKYSTGLVIPAGRYIVTGFRIDQPVQIVGMPGLTTLISASEKPVLILDNADNVTLNGLTFEGSGSAASAEGRNSIVNAGRSSDLLIENCTFVNGPSSGLSLIECSGRIAALGEGVTDLAIGQDVVAIAAPALASSVITAAHYVVPKPGNLTFDEAATIPVAEALKAPVEGIVHIPDEIP